MARLDTQITALYGIGADAMDNLFDIDLSLPQKLGDFVSPYYGEVFSGANMQQQFRLRCNGFEPPKFNQKKYEVRYKTVSMNRPAAAIEGSREFSLTFRIDAYYRVYTALLGWRSILFEPSTGYASPNLPISPTDDRAALDEYFGNIRVYTLIHPPTRKDASYDLPGLTSGSIKDSPGKASSAEEVNDMTEALAAWEFFHVWISDLTEPTFTTGGGDAQEVTATFQFGEYRAPSSPSSL